MPRPDWVNVRSDLSPQGAGYIMLDKANLGNLGGDTSWSYPTLATNLTTNLYNPVRYRKLNNGTVLLQGGFQYTAPGGSPSFTGNIFTFPVGYRPLGLGSGGGGNADDRYQTRIYHSNATNVTARLTVESDGAVSTSTAINLNGFIEFGAVIFYAEN